MLGGILSKYSLTPDQVMMVGDRIYTDVQMAANAGAVGVLVLSGETTLEIAKEYTLVPDIIAENLGELQAMFEEALAK